MNIWDKTREIQYLPNPKIDDYPGGKIDTGVNFFLGVLIKIGAEPRYSCEGHPSGFYVFFKSTKHQAMIAKVLGYFNVEVEAEDDCWSLRTAWQDGLIASGMLRKDVMQAHHSYLRRAAAKWEKFTKMTHEDIFKILDTRFIRK